MITRQHIQECLSVACVHAFAGKAGMNLNLDSAHDYGVDGIIKDVQIAGNKRFESGFHIDFQLKSTVSWKLEDNSVVYDMEASAYNKLVGRPAKASPCLLILLCLPKEQDSWLSSTEDAIVLKNCCYWIFLSGDQTDNSDQIRIRIPRSQLLTADAVQDIMANEKARLWEDEA